MTIHLQHYDLTANDIELAYIVNDGDTEVFYRVINDKMLDPFRCSYTKQAPTRVMYHVAESGVITMMVHYNNGNVTLIPDGSHSLQLTDNEVHMLVGMALQQIA